MKKKARISYQILVIIFVIQSCSTVKDSIYDTQILEAVHELEKLKELISLSDICPALARENEVEAALEYKKMIFVQV